MNTEEKKQAFKTLIEGAISEKCTELTRQNDGKISYNEAKNIVHFVEMVFVKHLGFTPKQITAACSLALTFLAPTTKEKVKMLKTVVSTMSGICGLAAIIGGVGLACGWGAGTVAAVVAWFTGTSMLGPFAWIVSGTSVIVIAGYFYFSSDDAKDAERFEKVLKGGLDKAIDEIWREYGDKIDNNQSRGLSGRD